MTDLLPFARPVIIRHKFLEFEKVWITNVRPSFFVGHNWQYEVRTDRPLEMGSAPSIQRWLWGGEWFDEMDLQPYDGEQFPMSLNIQKPTQWPPRMTRTIGRRSGLWVSNGHNDNIDLMYSLLPGSITCFDEYLSWNGVFNYKMQHPEIPIIIRFQHHLNWQDDPVKSAVDLGQRIISKWDEIQPLDPYVYFANEMNLHYENGDKNSDNQHLYTTPEFYQKYADWVRVTADVIKNIVPEMKLVTPPFAFGHKEDGEPDDNGKPKLGWAGYDYLVDTIRDYFDNILTFHAYWGDGRGRIAKKLYDPDLSSWYAFRWRRVLKLFEVHYGVKARMVIDEAGCFNAGHPDFFDDIKYYSQECLKDGRVLALTYFLWNDPTNSPGNVPNSWTHKIDDLPTFVGKLKALPDIQIDGEPPPPPPPDPEPEPEPEPDPTQGIKMIVDYEEGLGLIVGNWFGAGEQVTLRSPWDENKTTSGSKPEFGPGGFEAGYAMAPGIYKLLVGDYIFEIVQPDPAMFIKLSFERGDEPGAEEMVRLVSNAMEVNEAEMLLARLEENYPGIFSVVVADKYE